MSQFIALNRFAEIDCATTHRLNILSNNLMPERP